MTDFEQALKKFIEENCGPLHDLNIKPIEDLFNRVGYELYADCGQEINLGKLNEQRPS